MLGRVNFSLIQVRSGCVTLWRVRSC